MSRQTTLFRNMDTGRIEMANANQPFNYDEDLSESSMSGDEVESKKHVIYLTTNMLTPASQPINEIEVDTFNED
jgi:hypothetical protein